MYTYLKLIFNNQQRCYEHHYLTYIPLSTIFSYRKNETKKIMIELARNVTPKTTSPLRRIRYTNNTSRAVENRKINIKNKTKRKSGTYFVNLGRKN